MSVAAAESSSPTREDLSTMFFWSFTYLLGSSVCSSPTVTSMHIEGASRQETCSPRREESGSIFFLYFKYCLHRGHRPRRACMLRAVHGGGMVLSVCGQVDAHGSGRSYMVIGRTERHKEYYIFLLRAQFHGISSGRVLPREISLLDVWSHSNWVSNSGQTGDTYTM